MMGKISTATALKTEQPLSADDIFSNGHIVHPGNGKISSRIAFSASLYFFGGAVSNLKCITEFR
jgi:hypothetical protein